MVQVAIGATVAWQPTTNSGSRVANCAMLQLGAASCVMLQFNAASCVVLQLNAASCVILFAVNFEMWRCS